MSSPAGARPRLIVVATLVTVVAAAGIPARATYGAHTTADEPHYLLTALSLWEDGDLDYGDERADVRYWPFHSVVLPFQAERRADGEQLAPHEPLLPAILAVPMGLGGWVGAKLAMAALAGLLAAITCWVLERRVGVRSSVAVGAAIIAGCSPPLVVYGSQIYPELLGAIAALAGFAAVSSPSLTRRASWAVVVAVVVLPWLNVKYALVAAALAVGLLVRLAHEGPWRRAFGAAGALAAAGVVFVGVHQAVFGGPTAYAAGLFFQDGDLTVMGNRPDYAGRSGRLVGLLVDRDFGLAAWQPLALLAIPALTVWCVRRQGREWWVLAAMVGAGWFTATYLALTMHGWWWPGRQTVVVVPLIVVAIASMVDRWSPTARAIVATIGGLGVWMYAWLVGGVIAGAHTLIVDFERTAEPVGWLWRRALPDRRSDAALDDALFALWVAGTIAVVVTIVVRQHRRPVTAGAIEVAA